ncbi:MAG: 2-C-methyl-D-erythritol 4-phosphate cytidylyltransferase [Oscillospiraceae bacterium]
MFPLNTSKKHLCSAVVVAAGSSQRFGGDKIFALLQNIPVLAYSLLTLNSSENVSEIIVVTDSSKIENVAKLCETYKIHKVTKIVCGGETRVHSALSGISEADPKAALIAIHDGARPLVTLAVINSAIESAMKHKAAVPVLPARDTVKIVKEGRVQSTPDRASAFCAQTPQVFVPELIKGALTSAAQNELIVSDDAQAMELLNIPVYVTEGSEENIKITTPLDLMLAEAILRSRKEKFAASNGACL